MLIKEERVKITVCVGVEEMKALREAYLNARGADKTSLERRYGKVVLKQLVEESFSEDWLRENSKRCPHCNTHIQVKFVYILESCRAHHSRLLFTYR